MSLTSCLKKAGDAITTADRAAILSRARELRAEGVDTKTAAVQAVQERIDTVDAELKPLSQAQFKKPDAAPVQDAANEPAVAATETATAEAPAQKRGDEPMPSGLTLEEARAQIRTMRGARAADVQKIVDEVTGSWKGGPKVTVVQTAADLPGDNPSDVRGLYERGQVWIVAGAHRNGPTMRRAVSRTLAHETVAHYGLRDMLGREDWKQLMANIQLGVKAGNKELRRIQAFVRETYVDASGQFYLSASQEADEIAAKAVEEAIDENGNFHPGFGFLKAVWAKVAQFLRDLGIKVQFTNAELQGMLVLSMRNLEAGARTAGGGQLAVAAAREDGPMQARGADQTETDSFRAWFGDSKVVDAEGKPLVMYHGTGNNVTAFEPSRPGPHTDMGAVFLTADPAVASHYAQVGSMFGDRSPNVMPAYVRARNPFDYENPTQRAAVVDRVFETAETYTQGDGQKALILDGRETLYTKGVLDAGLAEGRNWDLIERKQVQDAIKHLGHDGFYVNEDTKNLAVYDPAQIKSATGNRGTFDPFDANIMHARGATAGQQDEAAVPARPETSPWRDATGRLQFAPGAWLYDKLGTAAGPLLTKLQFKAASPALRRALREMKVQVAKAQETAAAVAGEAMKLSPDERAMVSDLIEQELAAGTVPPEHAVRLAAMINASMSAQTDELVRLGMLTKDSADLWRGKYLPRYYQSKLGKQVGDAWADAMHRMLGRQKVMAGIKGKHLRGRGLYETIPASSVAEWESLGWEVRDQDFNGSDGAGISQKILQGEVAPEDTVQVWRDFTRDERNKMGEIRDAGFRFVMGYMQTQRDIALGRMFEQLAGNAEMSGKKETEAFSVQVPDGTVPGTGAKRYGQLAGRWVSQDTMSHLSQIEEVQSAAWRMYRQAMAVWKMGKTSMNPVSHVNNMLSNLTMAHFAGIGYLRADKYIAAARDFAVHADRVKEAKEAGLFLGTLSDAELMNVLPEDLKAMVRSQESTALKAARTGFDVMTFFLRRPMGWAYQAEDTFFRYLIYKDARERGMEPQDSVDYAQRYIFTYDDLPKGARLVRDFGIPFFSYTYKAAPALLHTALTHPVRFAGPAAVLLAANAISYAIASGDDDDSWDTSLRKLLTDAEFRDKVRVKEKLEREHLPSWMRGTTALFTPRAIRLGMDEVTKLPLFIDVSRIIPGGDLFDVSPNAGGIPLPQPITPSHPLFTTAVAMIGNKDLFFGKDLVDTNDTRGEAATKRADWVWKQLSPAIAMGNYHWERGMNALAQASGGEIKWLPEVIAENYTGIGRDGNPVQAKYAAAQTFGIKVRPIDLEMAEKIDGNLRNKMVRDIDAEVHKLQRLNAKGAISDNVMEKERAKALEKKQRLREGLTVDGDEKN
jgi:hypothetical protein